MKLRLRYLVPAVISILTAVVYLALTGEIDQPAPIAGRAQVELGKDYYISVPLIELSESDQAGQAWDGYNSTGPDIFYEIIWKGHRIFQSTVKEDTFVAKWSNVEVDVAKLALNGSTSLETLVQAARLNIQAGEVIEINVYDADAVSTDLAGKKTFAAAELKIGDSPHDYQDPGIKRLTIRVQDMAEIPDVTK